jgi:hypothetical protein
MRVETRTSQRALYSYFCIPIVDKKITYKLNFTLGSESDQDLLLTIVSSNK